MTVGYSTARDSNMVKKFDVTITDVQPQNIYNPLAVSLVGPLAAVSPDHKGQKVTFTDGTGAKVIIVQPLSNLYELHVGQKAVYIVDRGQVWVQPADYPLPPEFTTSPGSTPRPKAADSSITRQEPAPVITPSAAPVRRDASERLKTLGELLKSGEISKEEYEAKHKQILESL